MVLDNSKQDEWGCAHVHVAICHQSMLVPCSLVNINTKESNNRDRAEWRDEDVSDLLDIYEGISGQAKLEKIGCQAIVGIVQMCFSI